MVNKIIAVEKSLYLTKEDPLQSLLEKELEQKIEEIVADLPEKCQLVFKLSRKKNLQNKEIAEKLGISIKTVEKHITTALSVLRKEMTDYLIIVLPLIFLK